MKVRCFLTPAHVDFTGLPRAAAVVIDVLRATSSIIAMLESGARRVIPVDDIETARKLADSAAGGIALLAGEQKGRNIEGFDYGNSPLEFTPGAVEGRTVVLTTSNGTPAIVSASQAARVLICSINNVGAVAGAVSSERNLVVLCSGADGGFSSEDLLCAGLLIECLADQVDAESLDDAGRVALLLARTCSADIEEFLRACDRGRELLSLGFEADLSACARLNSSTLVPEARRGVISV